MAGVTEFGTTAGGQKVQRITLEDGDLTVAILTKGATLQSVRLRGVPHDLTLGSELLADYEGGMRHHGALVAPVVNTLPGRGHRSAARPFSSRPTSPPVTPCISARLAPSTRYGRLPPCRTDR